MRQGLWRPWRQEESPKPVSQPVYLAVVDPGSSALRVLDVCIGEAGAVGDRPERGTLAGAAKELPAVWGWGEQLGGDYGDAEHSRLAHDLEQALSAAEATARDRGARWRPSDHIVVGLPAAQMRGWSWPISQRRSQPDRPIEVRELEALLSRALRLAVSRMKQPAESDWLLVEAESVALTVDGRRVTDPVGFRGSEIGATVFAALARTRTIEAWRWAADSLSFSALTLTAAPLAVAASLSDSQCLVVDVGAGTTSVTWCRGGKPVCAEAFPVGGASLTQSLLRRWGMTLDRAESLKRAYAAGRLTPQARSQVQEVLSPAVHAWLDLLEQALTGVAEKLDEPLPYHLYLCGGGSALAEMAEATRTLAWNERLDFARYPQVDCLKPTDVPAVVNRTDLGRSAGDVSALALAAWAGRQNEPPSRPTRILRKLCEP